MYSTSKYIYSQRVVQIREKKICLYNTTILNLDKLYNVCTICNYSKTFFKIFDQIETAIFRLERQNLGHLV